MQQRLNLAAANGQNPHPIRGEGELLPCPFCGHDGEVRQTHDEFSRRRAIVVCRGCDASSEPSIGEARAIAAWNRRAHPPTSYEGEGLREALEVAAVQLQLAGGWLRESGDDGQRANTLLNASNKAREALQSASEK
jgi:Lar family restriction alleviation protein